MATDTDMDEQLFRQEHGWSLRLQSGQEMKLAPRAEEASETLCVTDVFLVDSESAAGQGVVAACVDIGTRNLVFAALSSERPHLALQTPVVLDDESWFYLMRPEGDADAVVVQFQGYALPSANTTEEEDEDDDGIDEADHEPEEESEGRETDDDDEDATGYDYDSRDDGEVWGLPLGVEIVDGPSRDDEEDDGDGERGGRAARSSRARRNKRRRRKRFVAEDEGRSFGEPAPPQFAFSAERPRRRVAPEAAILGIFVFVYLMVFVALLVRG